CHYCFQPIFRSFYKFLIYFAFIQQSIGHNVKNYQRILIWERKTKIFMFHLPAFSFILRGKTIFYPLFLKAVHHSAVHMPSSGWSPMLYTAGYTGADKQNSLWAGVQIPAKCQKL